MREGGRIASRHRLSRSSTDTGGRVADLRTARDDQVVFVNVDHCMVMQAVKLSVIARLQELFGADLYTNENVLLSGTHTHSGPGGFSWYVLYDVTTLGYVHSSLPRALFRLVWWGDALLR